MDEMVLQTQQWLNTTYGNDSRYEKVSENGQTSWDTIYALTRALQIEEGIQETSDNFGPTTERLCPTLRIQSADSTPTNYNYILQGALWCKGYSVGGLTGVFYLGTQSAVMEFESDAGLTPAGVVTPMIMKALLNMNAFVLVSGGDARVREMQQRLNNVYNSYFGLMPCDGRYMRDTNSALIYALQCEEGMDADTANGYFGNGTTNRCPTLSLNDSRTNFVYILQYALYCNGFDPGDFDGIYDSGVASATRSFQSFVCLPVTGIANMPTIKSLLASCGDTSRPGTACDCATILTSSKAATLKNNGYEYVGRYLTGTIGGGVSKALSSEEIGIIFDAGLKIFPLFETAGYYLDYFTPAQGNDDAKTAMTAAVNLGIPYGTIIYFAVDFDAYDYQVTDIILPYFQAIKDRFASFGNKYKIGVYGARNICIRVAEEGCSVSSFVGDMSTGFSGNLGYRLPQNWAFDQITTITIGSGSGEIEIDKNIASGRDPGVNHVVNNISMPVEQYKPYVNPSEANCVDPVDTSTGAHTINMTAISVIGAQNLSFDLSYNSSKLVLGSMGKGWSNNFEISLKLVGNSIYFFETPSEYVNFIPNGSSSNTFTCNNMGRQNDVLTQNADGSYLLNRNNELKYSFDTSGKLINIQNRTGKNICVSHQSNGNLVITEPISGKSLTVSYNSSGIVSSVSDQLSNTCIFGYDANLCLTSITDANSKTTTYTYDKDGRVLTGKDGDSVRYFTDTYDDAGRIVSQLDAIDGSKQTYFKYDDTSVNGETIVTITDRNGNTRKNTFNCTRQLVSVIDENGNSKSYTYDSNGNLATEMDALGHVQSITYDVHNHPLEQTDFAGAKTKKTYDSNGNMLSVVNSDGGVTTYTYDTNNRVTSLTDTRGNNTTYIYDQDGLLIEKNVGTQKFSYIYENGMLKSAADPEGGVTSYTYDGAGRLTSTIDADKNKTVYVYDAKGNMLSKSDSLNNVTSFTYNSRGDILTQTDANGNVSKYQYNGNGKTVLMTDAKGNATAYNYDGEDRLTRTTDAKGNSTLITYDAVGHVIKRTDAQGNATAYTYDAVGNMLTQTNPSGGIIQRTYYPNGMIKTETNAIGNTNTYNYDAAWRLSKIINADDNATTYSYNSAGDLLSVIDPLGNTTKNTYDVFGNMLTKTDKNGNVTGYAYDANNNRISQTDALGNKTTYTYDAIGKLTSVTDANGNTISYTYDSNGRMISQKDALGNITGIAYDPNGNVMKKTDALGNSATYTYDAVNLQTTAQNALGNKMQNTFDLLGRLTTTVDPLGNTTAYSYDSNGRLVSATNALNGVSSYTFDADGNKTAIKNPLGGSISFTYDKADRLASETTASGGTIAYGYNAENLVSSLTNARGQKRTYTYDAAGRISEFTDAEGTTSYTYDKNGNVLTVKDAQGTIIREYDALNRIIKCSNIAGNMLQYTYDSVGNQTSIIYPDGKTVKYTYDATNRMTTVTDWANRVTSYTYDANGNLIKTVRPDGSVLAETYDAANRLTGMLDKSSAGNVISSYTFAYDANGNIKTENSSSMTYDALNRLTNKDNSSYSYDAAGNITLAGSSGQSATMAYDMNNRLTSLNGQTISYDADGNMIQSPLNGSTVNFTFDSGNRLIQAGSTTYAYDAENNRIAQTINGGKAQYVYDTTSSISKMLMCTDASGNKTYYVYGVGLIGEQNSSDAYSVYHYDYRGSTTAITDINGAVTDAYSYDAYGKLLSHTGTSATPFLYNGRDGVVSDANGLYYMRARYYAPEIKRFINADRQKGSIDDSRTLNNYAYANGNPVSMVDPFGLSAELSSNSSSPIVGFTLSSYDLKNINTYTLNNFLFNESIKTQTGIKTTIGKKGSVINYDQYSKGKSSGHTLEFSNTSIDMTSDSISVGTSLKNVTNSYGFNLSTGAFTHGIETESDTKYDNVKSIVSTEITYNINMTPAKDEVSRAVSDFQQAASAINDNNLAKGLEYAGLGIVAIGGAAYGIIQLIGFLGMIGAV